MFSRSREKNCDELIGNHFDNFDFPAADLIYRRQRRLVYATTRIFCSASPSYLTS